MADAAMNMDEGPGEWTWWQRVVLSPAPELCAGSVLIIGLLIWGSAYFFSYSPGTLGIRALSTGTVVAVLWATGWLRLLVPSSPDVRWFGGRFKIASGGIPLFLVFLLDGASLLTIDTLKLLLKPIALPFWVTSALLFCMFPLLFLNMVLVSRNRTPDPTSRYGFSLLRQPAHPRLAVVVGVPLLLVSIGLVGWFAYDAPSIFPAYSLGGNDITSSLAWSPDGSQLAALRQNANQIVVWDTPSQRTALALPCVNAFSSVGWSADGQLLAAGCATAVDSYGVPISADVEVWDARTGAHVLTIPSDPAAIAWSPLDDRLAVLTGDASSLSSNRIEIWNGTSGAQIASLALDAGAYQIAWSPDGRYLAVAEDDETLVLDARTGVAVQSFAQPGDEDTSLAWAPDSTSLLIASRNPDPNPSGLTPPGWTVSLWDVADGQRLLDLPEPPAGTMPATWSPDGSSFAVAISTVNSAVVDVYDARTGQGQVRFVWRGQDDISALAWSPDGQSVASGGFQDTVAVWQPEA